MLWNTEVDARWVDIYKTLHELGLLRFENLSTASQYWFAYENFLKHVSPQDSHVLDWGSGDGHFSYFLLSQGFNTHSFNVNTSDAYNPGGFQIAEFLDSRFKDAFHYKVSSGDPVHLPYEDETFHAVVSIGVLEHVRQEGGNEIGSLKEIHRILKKGGHFFCFHFPNKYSWIEALARNIASKHHHPYRFTKKDIYSLNQAAGLRVEEIKGYAVLPRNELSRLPLSIKNNLCVVKSYNAADHFLYSLLPPFFQNYYFLSRKPH
ncbi:MAG: class I SAM-dependent methyltransferase [Nitrospinae bacterium]|nr:class I SAM-dependent methyltransferase [Nitrospinota bacterium]MDA1108964.1 class I SAM-dependent methyltransferase [Nitrospinota bacterium]